LTWTTLKQWRTKPHSYCKATGPAMFKRSASLYNSDTAGLTDEETEFRNAVVDFAEREIAPRAAEIDKNEYFSF